MLILLLKVPFPKHHDSEQTWLVEDGPFLEGKVTAGDPSSPDDSFLLTLAAV